MTWLSRYFQLDELNSTVKREVLAGITTFFSMSYILFVNPNVLGAAKMNTGAVFTATALASALGCLLMGFLARYPIATAPALGINAFFSYSVVIGMGVSWQTALAGVFVASLIFLLITVFKLREIIINAIPSDLKYAIFDILENLAPGYGGEIQLTDGLKALCKRDKMVAVDFEGKRYDTGNLKGFLEATIDFSLAHPETGAWLRAFLKEKAASL